MLERDQSSPFLLPKNSSHALFSYEHVSWKEPSPCCAHTIQQLSSFNSIMVCDVCHSWIKVYDELKDFRNFLKFSNARSRKVEAFCREERYYAVYRIYPLCAPS